MHQPIAIALVVALMLAVMPAPGGAGAAQEQQMILIVYSLPTPSQCRISSPIATGHAWQMPPIPPPATNHPDRPTRQNPLTRMIPRASLHLIPSRAPMTSAPMSIRQMCPATLIWGHCSGHLTSAQRCTITNMGTWGAGVNNARVGFIPHGGKRGLGHVCSAAVIAEARKAALGSAP
jgi:hypothetical protein